LSERCGRHCWKIRFDAPGLVQRTRVRRRIGGGTWSVSKAALAMFLDGDVKALQAYHAGDRTGPIVMPYSSAWGWDIYCLRGSLNQELTTTFSVLRKRRRAMRKAIAQLDAEQRETMLYLVDLGTAVFSSTLIVRVLKVVGDLM
jgi:hypothetical protein